MPDREESGPDGAEQAFEDLRAEVKVLRRAVEALPEAWAANRPANYIATLGQIAKGPETLAGQVHAIEQHPTIRMTPTQYNHAVVRAGEGAMDSVLRKLDGVTSDAVQARHQLAGLIGSMRGQQNQREWLVWTAAAALILGLLVSPALARFLPFGLDGQVAAFIMRADRWDAGAALMQAQSPEALMSADKLVTNNSKALGACRDAAAKTKKEQRCTIVVPSP